MQLDKQINAWMDTIGLDNHANHVNQSLEDITNVLHIGEQTHYNVIQVILKLIIYVLLCQMDVHPIH